MTTSPLRTEEAVQLAHALVEEVASSQNIRVLFIKGPSAAWWGLREARSSSDVDVLVEPGDVARLLGGMRDLGWHDRPQWLALRPLPHHSVTLIHERWPCDLDVHTYFPGVFASPDVAFDEMWASRAQMEIAGVSVCVPSRAVSACILALHSLRDPQSDRTASELPFLIRRVRDEFGPSELHELDRAATALRSRYPLVPFLSEIGLDAAEPDLDEDERFRWDLRVRRTSSSTAWTDALRLSPWHVRPVVVWRALTYVDPHDSESGRPRSRQRLRYRAIRLARGARQVGEGIRALGSRRRSRAS